MLGVCWVGGFCVGLGFRLGGGRMIEAIEVLLMHWGEELRTNGSAGGLGSMLGTVMEYGGCAPRGGVKGSRELLAGSGPDYVAEEVQAGLCALAGSDDAEKLMRLAEVRYRAEPRLSISEQADVLDLGRGARGSSAYYRLLDRLHERLQVELLARQQRLKARRRESGREGARHRAMAIKQAKAAHQARGSDLFKGGR